MSVGMSSVGVLVPLREMGIAWGYSSSMVICTRVRGGGSLCRLQQQNLFRTSTAIEGTLFKVKHKKSQPRITGVDRWSTTTNLCSTENFPRPSYSTSSYIVISLPSALTRLILCVGSICVQLTIISNSHNY